ncbi:hypothetical protein RchiOBHm_Chr2g0171311 [Rosa chinensis]|uniref:Uncharacterized protein n=1 Tax=Rosa chinensis TaxID=74649 RepID=A0A2P6S5A5_ROSCH|nr:hypothetical protein RchiOBHm_Chr2g0171311 [Rosa chinensis]
MCSSPTFSVCPSRHLKVLALPWYLQWLGKNHRSISIPCHIGPRTQCSETFGPGFPAIGPRTQIFQNFSLHLLFPAIGPKTQIFQNFSLHLLFRMKMQHNDHTT